MNYRFDNRSEAQFKEDIKEATNIEKDLMLLYVKWLNEGNGKHPPGSYSFIDNGVDNTGEYIKEDTNVHTGADFILQTKSGRDKKIEIKFSRESTRQLHYKINQLKSYIKDDVCMVTFMDFSNHRFFILTPKDMQNLLDNGYKCRFWQKDCVRLYTKDVKWHYAKN